MVSDQVVLLVFSFYSHPYAMQRLSLLSARSIPEQEVAVQKRTTRSAVAIRGWQCRGSIASDWRFAFFEDCDLLQSSLAKQCCHRIFSPPIERTAHAFATTLQHVCINHGCFDVLVP